MVRINAFRVNERLERMDILVGQDTESVNTGLNHLDLELGFIYYICDFMVN